MINAFLRHKVKNLSSSAIKLKDIQNANKVLFALFTRYGDTIIDLVVIQEFVEKHPSKDSKNRLKPRQLNQVIQLSVKKYMVEYFLKIKLFVFRQFVDCRLI